MAADIDAQLAAIGATLGARVDELAQRVVSAIRAEVDFYRQTAVIPDDQLLADTTANLRYVFAALHEGSAFDTSPAVTTGSNRAQAGVPLPAVMDAFRVASHVLWGVMIDLARAAPGVGAEALLRATALFWQAQDRYTAAMTGAYRQQAMQQVLDDEAERSALTEALLEGRLSEDQSLWEVAQLLRIPAHGPYVVAVAASPAVGKQALPGVTSMLRSIDVFSAWRLLPDIHIGIAHIPSMAALDRMIALLERISATRVGLSPQYGDLADTAQALRYARNAMAARAHDDRRVSVFDDTLLGVAAVSATEATRKVAEIVLACFADLPMTERDVLFATFRAWADTGGSVQEAATRLVCHPNTVRYRLRRIKERTERSLRAPRDVAELSLAFEIVDRTP